MFKLTLPPLSWPGYDDDSRDEDGFTLIEILVVIIIIGILAAVAIPIFLNQQRTARDSATTQDVRNAATAIETGMVYDPTATEYKAYTEDAAGEQGAEIAPVVGADGVATVIVPEAEEAFYLQVGDKATPAKVTKSEGTVLEIKADDVDGVNGVDPGAFRIDGWNEKGKEHKNDSTLVYRNALGGLQSESGTGSGSTTPGDESENPGAGGGTETETPGSAPLEIDGITHGEGDWWQGRTSGWVMSGAGVSAPSSISPGETVSIPFYAYLPSGRTGTGEAHFAPDGATLPYKVMVGEYQETVHTGVAVASGGRFVMEFTAPANAGRWDYLEFTYGNYYGLPAAQRGLTLPDGSSTGSAILPASFGNGDNFDYQVQDGAWVYRAL